MEVLMEEYLEVTKAGEEFVEVVMEVDSMVEFEEVMTEEVLELHPVDKVVKKEVEKVEVIQVVAITVVVDQTHLLISYLQI